MEEELLKKFCISFPFTDELSRKTILVTGGTGLIGSYILKCIIALIDKFKISIRIFATARNPEKIKNFNSNIHWLIRDLNCKDDLPDKIDVIFHTACQTQSIYLKTYPVDVINDSIDGTRFLLEYCRRNLSCQLIYLSSIEIYGQKEDDFQLTKESDYGYLEHLNIRSCYPESKKMIETMCESYVSQYGVNAKIARLTQTIGADVPPTDNRIFVQFAKSIVENKNIILHTNGKSSKSYVHVIDAVSAFFYITFKGESGGAYNVANMKTYMSVIDLADFVIKNFNSNIKIQIEKRDDFGYAPDTKINLSTSKLEDLGWQAKIGLYEMFESLINVIKDRKG